MKIINFLQNIPSELTKDKLPDVFLGINYELCPFTGNALLVSVVQDRHCLCQLQDIKPPQMISLASTFASEHADKTKSVGPITAELNKQLHNRFFRQLNDKWIN